MNLFHKTNNGGPESEAEMQSAVESVMIEKLFCIKESEYVQLREFAHAKVYREVRIPEVGRISDIIVQITPRKIVNIECKLFQYTEVMAQARDHLHWADYSYICLHSNSLLPPYIVRNMIDAGLGLMFWSKGTGVIDVVGAGHNTYKAGKKNRTIRESVMRTLQQRDSLKTAESHEQKTIEL